MDETISSEKINLDKSSKEVDGSALEMESGRSNVCPLKLEWAVGMSAEIPVVNLTTRNRNLIGYAVSHMVILYDYVANDTMSLQGHQNFVRSLSASRDGKWLLSADYDENSVCIVWDTETRVPICTLFNPHGSKKLAAAELSPDGKYLVTVGNENEQVVKLWLWTRGGDKPDGTVELKDTREDRVKKISFNDDYPDQFVLTLDHSAIFISWRDGNLSVHRPRLQTKDQKTVGSLNDTCYVSKTHLAMSVTSNGFVLVWSDVLHNERFESRTRSSNRKRLVKSVPLRKKRLTRIENEDEIIVIGNESGQLFFYDYQLKLIYWCENCGFDSIVSIGFDKNSDLTRPLVDETESSVYDPEPESDDFEILDSGEDDDEDSKKTEVESRRSINEDDPEEAEEDDTEATKKADDETETEKHNVRKSSGGEEIKLAVSNVTRDIDYSTEFGEITGKPTDCGLKPAEFAPPKLFILFKSMCNTAVGNKNCKQLFSRILACMAKREESWEAEMMSASHETLLLNVQFLIPTEHGTAEDEGTSCDPKPIVSCPLVCSTISEYVVTGDSLGTLRLYKYTTRSLMVTKNTPKLPNFADILNVVEEKPDTSHVTCPRTHESLVAVSVLRFSPGSGEFLACGLQSGAIWILHPDTLDPIDPIPYKHSASTIIDITFSECGEYFAYSDDALTVGAFKRNNNNTDSAEGRRNLWHFLGKYHSHFMPIRQILFCKPTVGKSVPRFLSLGEDQELVEYDLENSGPYPKPGLLISQIDRIERTAVPLCIAVYPQFGTESFLISSNSKHKFRLLNDLTKTTRATYLGPTFGEPVEKILMTGQQKRLKNREYMIFATRKEIGLMILPFDGNPHKILAMIGHPGKIESMAISACGSYLFTIGKNDRSLLMWRINYRSVDVIVHLGGEGLAPFYRMIDGGKAGWLVNEIKDLFYYAQILHQGENTTATRIVTDKLSIMQLPNIMRAIGFYPTNGELENMMEEVSYKNYADTGELIDEITFEEFVKLYVNHRPAFGVTRNEIKESFKAFAGPGDFDNPCLSAKQFLEVLFGRGGCNRNDGLSDEKLHGEPLSVDEAHAYLRRLVPQDEDSTSYTGSRDDKAPKAELNFEFLPPNISYKDFVEEILGIEQPEVSKMT